MAKTKTLIRGGLRLQYWVHRVEDTPSPGTTWSFVAEYKSWYFNLTLARVKRAKSALGRIANEWHYSGSINHRVGTDSERR